MILPCWFYRPCHGSWENCDACEWDVHVFLFGLSILELPWLTFASDCSTSDEDMLTLQRGSILGRQIQRRVLNSQLCFSRTGGCAEWWRCWRRRLLQATASSNARFAPFDAGVFAFHSIHYLTSTVFKQAVVVCNASSNPAQAEWSERNRSCLLASSHWPKTPKTQRFPATPPFPENFPSPPASGCRRVSFISVANLYALSRGGSQTVPRGRFDRGGAEFKDMIRACPGFWQFVLRCFTASVQDEKVQLRKKIQYQIAIAEVVVCSYLHMPRKDTCVYRELLLTLTPAGFFA